tara:strand:+ start:266 stop:412 length:147 start_codon:yes stop_codon:yes gene_type:complete
MAVSLVRMLCLVQKSLTFDADEGEEKSHAPPLNCPAGFDKNEDRLDRE